VDGQEQDQFRRAARNLKSFRYYSVAGLNVYDLLKYDSLIVTKSSIEHIVKRCGVEK
jgi:ribosomal protein L4